MSELRAQELKKRFKSRSVVKDVSLEVQSGEVVGLLGPNGAGKTTCFYMIVGLIPTDGGNIYLDQKNLNRMPIHRRARMGLAYLPQEASIFRGLTAEQNIRATAELLEPDGARLEAMVSSPFALRRCRTGSRVGCATPTSGLRPILSKRRPPPCAPRPAISWSLMARFINLPAARLWRPHGQSSWRGSHPNPPRCSNYLARKRRDFESGPSDGTVLFRSLQGTSGAVANARLLTLTLAGDPGVALQPTATR